MAEIIQTKHGRPLTLRGDEEFFAAVKGLQTADDSPDVPTKSEVIRRAVLRDWDRVRAKQQGGKVAKED